MLLLGFVLKPLKREVPKRPAKPVRETYAYRWSRLVQHHPWPAAIVGTFILVLLALPVLGMRLGFSDESQFHEDTTTRQAYELLVDGFGPGYNGPFFLVAQVDEEVDPAVLEQITADIAADPGVAFVTPAVPNTLIAPDRDLGAYLWKVTPTTSPQDRGAPTRSSTASATRCSSTARPRSAPTSTSPASSRPPSTSPATCRRACRTSSPPCSCCRSCC